MKTISLNPTWLSRYFPILVLSVALLFTLNSCQKNEILTDSDFETKTAPMLKNSGTDVYDIYKSTWSSDNPSLHIDRVSLDGFEMGRIGFLHNYHMKRLLMNYRENINHECDLSNINCIETTLNYSLELYPFDAMNFSANSNYNSQQLEHLSKIVKFSRTDLTAGMDEASDFLIAAGIYLEEDKEMFNRLAETIANNEKVDWSEYVKFYDNSSFSKERRLLALSKISLGEYSERYWTEVIKTAMDMNNLDMDDVEFVPFVSALLGRDLLGGTAGVLWDINGQYVENTGSGLIGNFGDWADNSWSDYFFGDEEDGDHVDDNDSSGGVDGDPPPSHIEAPWYWEIDTNSALVSFGQGAVTASALGLVPWWSTTSGTSGSSQSLLTETDFFSGTWQSGFYDPINGGIAPQTYCPSCH